MLRDVLIQKGLSNREAEVAELVSKGLSNKEVANRLFVTEKTVKFYADALNITTKHLNRVTRATINKTTSEFILDRVILEAKRLIVHSNNSLSSSDLIIPVIVKFLVCENVSKLQSKQVIKIIFFITFYLVKLDLNRYN